MLDTQQFLHTLDQYFAKHTPSSDIRSYLLTQLHTTQEQHDTAGEFTVLNEILGFYRSQGMHNDNTPMIERLITVLEQMNIDGSDAWTTAVINIATAYRAAGNYSQAELWYQRALHSAEHTLGSTDRRLAALHNNLSMLYSEQGSLTQAASELDHALHIITASSTDPSCDIDVASTHTNLALVLAQSNQLDTAYTHATEALHIYRQGGLENSGHFASALASFAQVSFLRGDIEQAVRAFELSLIVIEQCYGKDTESYAVTKSNLHSVLEAATQAGIDIAPMQQIAHIGDDFSQQVDIFWDALHIPSAGEDNTQTPQQSSISGLELSRRYWQELGKPMLQRFLEHYPELQNRVAVGLVGHGSECYGFDDEYSHDHDFGPRLCFWLTDDDFARYGKQLQEAYDAMPHTFMGYSFETAQRTPRSQGAQHRDGVFAIGDFFEGITGYRSAPAGDAEHAHQWLLLDEATLAAATNGEIFADPLGAFSSRRQGFKAMPDDVRLALISRRLGMISQAGQYNLPRMLKRGDGVAAMLAIHEFVRACASVVFLINQPITVGYLPYYKWQFAALRKLSARMATLLPEVPEQLESLLRLASAACYGGEGFGEGGKGSAPAVERITQIVDTICASILMELRRADLTRSDEQFLEWQRPYVEEHISNPWLRSL